MFVAPAFFAVFVGDLPRGLKMFELDERMLSDGGAQYALCRGAPFLKRFHALGGEKGTSMQIQQIMSQPVFFCRVGDNLGQAARLMWEHSSGVVPIVDGAGKVVAMLTDRDICMAAYTQGKLLSDIDVRVAMSQALVSCRPEDSLEEAEQRMSAHQIRRLPVVNGRGEPVGILSLCDLVRTAAQSQPQSQGNGSGAHLNAKARTLATVSLQLCRSAAKAGESFR